MVSSPTTPPGLPPASAPPTGGSSNNLNADSGDWSNFLLPTSIGNVGGSAGTGLVPFPCVMFKEQQTNSLAVHTYPNLDSARVEVMGRDPGIFHIRGIFTNSIFPNTLEAWIPGILFPNVFLAVINILDNTFTDKTFVHPVYGKMTVDVKSWSYELNPKNG